MLVSPPLNMVKPKPTPTTKKREKMRSISKKSLMVFGLRKQINIGSRSKSSFDESQQGGNFPSRETKKDKRLLEIEEMGAKRASLPPTA